MRPFWSPLSALLLPAPRIYAPLQLLTKTLGSGRAVELFYAGDRMWPAFSDGQLLRARAVTSPPVSGSAVIATPEGVPELLRVAGRLGEDVLLVADADPANAIRTQRDRILAGVEAPLRRPLRPVRLLRRCLLDLREALRPWEPGGDPASSVLLKYDAQAPYYVAASGPGLEASLRRRILESVPRGGRILVVGSGTGRECFELAREGYAVSGLDFSPQMVSHAREEAKRQGLAVGFQVGDLRLHAEDAASLAAVVFTYEVYSFMPTARERVEALRSMACWLQPGGGVFLSARRLRGAYEVFVLSVLWLAGLRTSKGAWGDSRSRWIAPDGGTRRSFLHIFQERSLRREIEEAGLRMGPWEGGHSLLSVSESSSTRT
ncbi:MAG TPA: class I SAM-dependent methyltransferase [Candidatus Polarisedimenticolia bacterium]|nr:class I SAM-dependent methyltransferase [Candidatus Polarisedimenticolia bacterium]